MKPTNETPSPRPKKRETDAFPAEATSAATRLQEETDADAYQNASLMHTANANHKAVKPAPLLFSHSAATTTRDGVSEGRFLEDPGVVSARKTEQSAGSTAHRHRCPQFMRRPPEEELNPLATFMLLRSRHTAPATEASQSSTPGTLGNDCAHTVEVLVHMHTTMNYG